MHKQMVIKESKTIPVEHWTGQVPEEVKMMQSMNTTKCRAVPELLAYKRYPHVRKHRIYMEFCPYSDLATLNSKYQRFRYLNPRLYAFLFSSNGQRTYFPEPFLWHTFNNLVKVAAAMENGPEYTKWNYQIVHRDLKPANSTSYYSILPDLCLTLTTWLSIPRSRGRGEWIPNVSSRQDRRLGPRRKNQAR